MFQSGVLPANHRQRFLNTPAKAEVGAVLTDPDGSTVEKVSYNSVRVSGVLVNTADYSRELIGGGK